MTLSRAKHTENARDRFEVYLKKQHMRRTPERLALVDTLLHLDKPFTCEELFETAVAEHHLRMCRASVYNTLALLVKARIVETVNSQRSTTTQERHQATLYRRRNLSRNEMRFVCVQCGRDIPLKRLRLTEQMKQLRAGGFRPVHYIMAFYGQCADCANETTTERTNIK